MSNNFKASGWEFRVISLLAVAAAGVIFGTPNSYWWDNGGSFPKILVGIAAAYELYALSYIIRNIKL